MYNTTDYLLFGKINRSNVNISTQIITDFLSGDHKRIASSLLNWYSDQAIKQIEDKEEILAFVERLSKRDVFLIAEEAERVCNICTEVAINSFPSKVFRERIHQYVEHRRIQLLCVINDNLAI